MINDPIISRFWRSSDLDPNTWIINDPIIRRFWPSPDLEKAHDIVGLSGGGGYFPGFYFKFFFSKFSISKFFF